jgi:hypothetical protein
MDKKRTAKAEVELDLNQRVKLKINDLFSIEEGRKDEVFGLVVNGLSSGVYSTTCNSLVMLELNTFKYFLPKPLETPYESRNDLVAIMRKSRVESLIVSSLTIVNSGDTANNIAFIAINKVGISHSFKFNIPAYTVREWEINERNFGCTEEFFRDEPIGVMVDLSACSRLSSDIGVMAVRRESKSKRVLSILGL